MRRLISIDILRAVAVILVLFRHSEHSGLLGKVGWSGVDLFFVLSGFLVSGLLFKEQKKTGKIDGWNFLIRRGFKIYPLFYLLISLTVAKSIFVALLGIEGNKNFSLQTMLSEVFFVQNYFPRIWSHTWSLAVEEHFYLLLVFFISFLIRKGTISNRIFFRNAFISLALFCLALRVYMALGYPIRIDTHVIPTHLRIDSLFFGVYLSHIFHYNPSLWASLSSKKTFFVLLAIVCLCPMFLFSLTSETMVTIGLTLTYIGYGSLLILFLSSESIIQSNHQTHHQLNIVLYLVSTIGKHSYAIYLFHIPLLVYVVDLIPVSNLFFTLLLYIFLCICVGVMISKMIEFPMLKLRDRLFPNFSALSNKKYLS